MHGVDCHVAMQDTLGRALQRIKPSEHIEIHRLQHQKIDSICAGRLTVYVVASSASFHGWSAGNKKVVIIALKLTPGVQRWHAC